MHMRLRDLEARLQRVKPFDTRLQKIELEQFPTGPEIASRLVYTASSSFDDIEGKVVVDLGTGTGRLGIGCALMGASLVIGIDADMDALAIAQKNIDEAEVQMELLLSDVSTMPLGSLIGKVDTVVMNPPFGTRNKGIDVAFLKQALHLQPRAIYSLHKTSTRKFLINKAQSEWGLEVEVLAELRFDIPKMYKQHKKDSVDVQVDFIRYFLPDCLRGSETVLPMRTLFGERQCGAAAQEGDGK